MYEGAHASRNSLKQSSIYPQVHGMVCSPLTADGRAQQRGQATNRTVGHADVLKLYSDGYSQGKHVESVDSPRPPTEVRKGLSFEFVPAKQKLKHKIVRALN
jgi:hypothetical protein